ncbi:MAG: hypothetical protein IJW67_12790 [Blautia sp.]|nr:hypothetical protein [Blautia sp.]
MTLYESITAASEMVLPLLNGETLVDSYTTQISNIIDAVKNSSDDDIKGLPLQENVIATILADKKLIETRFQDKKDQTSMFSTLIVYIACLNEGLPDHSRIYMDRVTTIRKKLDTYFGEETQKFCGS